MARVVTNHAPLPTLKDVARAANVSHTAVSFALRGRADDLGLSDSVRKRILEAAQKLGYRPHRSALALRSQKTRVIGFVTPSAPSPDGVLQNYGVHPFVVGLNHRLVAENYHVAYLEVGELELGDGVELPMVLRERFFDGLVVHYGLSAPARQVFASLNIPAVWWDSGIFDPSGCIYRDEAHVTRLIVKRLIELGHRRIAFMVGQSGWEKYLRGLPVHFSYTHRYESYCAEMRGHGLPKVEITGYDIQNMARQIRKHDVTAVIVQGTGESVMLLSQAAAQLGKQIPRDLSIASSDLEARMPQRAIRVGGVAYDRYEAGRQAGEMILAMLDESVGRVPSVKILGEFQPGHTIMTAPNGCNN